MGGVAALAAFYWAAKNVEESDRTLILTAKPGSSFKISRWHSSLQSPRRSMDTDAVAVSLLGQMRKQAREVVREPTDEAAMDMHL